MSEPLNIVPLTNLNKIIESEYREAVIRQALEHGKAHKGRLTGLDQVLKHILQIRGYMHPTSAPLVILLPAVIEAFQQADEVVAAVLALWQEANPGLDEAMHSFLQSAEVNLQPITPQAKHFFGLHTVPEMKRHQKSFCQEYPTYKQDDVFLMYLCLRGTFFSSLDLNEEEEDMSEIDKTQMGYIWADWLEQLRQLSPERLEWQAIDIFLAEIKALAEAKNQARQGTTHLRVALEELCQETHQPEFIEEFGGCSDWQVELCPPESLTAATEKILQLSQTFREYKKLEQQSPIKLSEKKGWHQKLSTLSDQAMQIYQELHVIFGAAHARESKTMALLQEKGEAGTGKSDEAEPGSRPSVSPDNRQSENGQSSVSRVEKTAEADLAMIVPPPDIEQVEVSILTEKSPATTVPPTIATKVEIPVVTPLPSSKVSKPEPVMEGEGGAPLPTEIGPADQPPAPEKLEAEALPEKDGVVSEHVVTKAAPQKPTPKGDRPINKTPAVKVVPIKTASENDPSPVPVPRLEPPESPSPADTDRLLIKPPEFSPPREAEDVLKMVEETLPQWLASWPHLPKVYLLTTWLKNEHPAQAAQYPSPELCQIAHYALQPGLKSGQKERRLLLECPNLDLLWQMIQDGSNELKAIAWQLTAALVTLQGEQTSQDLLEFRFEWASKPEFQDWSQLAEAVHLYWNQASEPILEVQHRIRAKQKHSQLKQEHEQAHKAAQDAFWLLQKSGKSQHLRNSIIREKLSWLPEALKQEAPDEQLAGWARKFNPEHDLNRWAEEIIGYRLNWNGPDMRQILRNFQNLQYQTNRWAKLDSSLHSDQSLYQVNNALNNLGQVIEQQGQAWRQTWAYHRAAWPALVGWSELLLSRLEEVIRTSD